MAGRGIMTKIFCTPYAQDFWELKAVFHDGTIYIMERETPERLESSSGRTEREKLMTYWGYRFETLSTVDIPPQDLENGDPQRKRAVLEARQHSSIVNTNNQFCSVVRTKLGSNEIVMGAEVDCMLAKNKPVGSRQSVYAELKTNRVIMNEHQHKNYMRHKLLRVYFQCWLAGIPTVIMGFRDDHGRLQKIEHIRTPDIPRMVRGHHDMWDAVICINFADAVLNWLWREIGEKRGGLRRDGGGGGGGRAGGDGITSGTENTGSSSPTSVLGDGRSISAPPSSIAAKATADAIVYRIYRTRAEQGNAICIEELDESSFLPF
ncbi:RAI1 like PD-XK nuclease-domain-containing protein [Zopfochytrium polystomum]|nr:RAI1 like PD-XK nuclease-domain-containing protein [Zopfochytrium polystomum]